ncbi:unnamed protein product [Prorocentrum cordatum]|uniref:Mono(ADP-ribosyl)transferase n=1 Tax=Prorocentrum cordatum TaxID=2364126 RepID=A0ABN9UGC5_9DINO|nr:unnamed protein product [Polarella glacialis]
MAWAEEEEGVPLAWGPDSGAALPRLRGEMQKLCLLRRAPGGRPLPPPPGAATERGAEEALGPGRRGPARSDLGAAGALADGGGVQGPPRRVPEANSREAAALERLCSLTGGHPADWPRLAADTPRVHSVLVGATVGHGGDTAVEDGHANAAAESSADGPLASLAVAEALLARWAPEVRAAAAQRRELAEERERSEELLQVVEPLWETAGELWSALRAQTEELQGFVAGARAAVASATPGEWERHAADSAGITVRMLGRAVSRRARERARLEDEVRRGLQAEVAESLAEERARQRRSLRQQSLREVGQRHELQRRLREAEESLRSRARMADMSPAQLEAAILQARAELEAARRKERECRARIDAALRRCPGISTQAKHDGGRALVVGKEGLLDASVCDGHVDLVRSLWRAKEGGILRELCQNLRQPSSEGRGLAAELTASRLADVCCGLRDRLGARETLRPDVKQHCIAIACWVLYAMPDVDIDRLLGFDCPELPEGSELPSKRDELYRPYRGRYNRQRNPHMFESANWGARDSVAQLASQWGQHKERQALTEVDKWVKWLCILGASVTTLDAPMRVFRVLTNLPDPLLDQLARKIRGDRLYWAAPSSVTDDESIAQSCCNRTGHIHTNVMFIVTGVSEAIPIEISKYPDERELVLPPFSVLEVSSVDDYRPSQPLVIECTFQGCQMSAEFRKECICDLAEASRQLDDEQQKEQRRRAELESHAAELDTRKHNEEAQAREELEARLSDIYAEEATQAQNELGESRARLRRSEVEVSCQARELESLRRKSQASPRHASSRHASAVRARVGAVGSSGSREVVPAVRLLLAGVQLEKLCSKTGKWQPRWAQLSAGAAPRLLWSKDTKGCSLGRGARSVQLKHVLHVDVGGERLPEELQPFSRPWDVFSVWTVHRPFFFRSADDSTAEACVVCLSHLSPHARSVPCRELRLHRARCKLGRTPRARARTLLQAARRSSRQSVRLDTPLAAAGPSAAGGRPVERPASAGAQGEAASGSSESGSETASPASPSRPRPLLPGKASEKPTGVGERGRVAIPAVSPAIGAHGARPPGMASLLARALGARGAASQGSAGAFGSPQTLPAFGIDTEDARFWQTPGAPTHTCHAGDGGISKGLLLAGNPEVVHRCSSKGVPDPGAMSKRAEALKRAEMLARFDHSYGSRRR